MKKLKKIHLLLAGLLLLVPTLVWFSTSRAETVETVQVRRGNISRLVEETGCVQPATEYRLYASQNAVIKKVNVTTGQVVQKGQPLVTMENLDLAYQLAELRARLSQAETETAAARAALKTSELELADALKQQQRLEKLLASDAVPRVEYEAAQLRVQTCRENLAACQSRLNSALSQQAELRRGVNNLARKQAQLTLSSPVTGTVLNLPAEDLQVVAPGTLLARVAAPNQLEVKADILSDDLAGIEVGQKATVSAPILGGKELAGEVKQIYPSAEEKESALGIIQRRVPVIISLPESGNLKPGFEVRVAIETCRRENVVLLPRSALRTTEKGQKRVMVVHEGRIQYRMVTTGIQNSEHVEITGGLKPGESVVCDGSLDLAPGSKVKSLKK